MAAFGSGMLFAVPILQRLLAHFRTPPVRIGGIEEVPLTLGEAGQRLAVVDGEQREVNATGVALPSGRPLQPLQYPDPPTTTSIDSNCCHTDRQ